MPLDCECDRSDQSSHKINFSASLCVAACFCLLLRTKSAAAGALSCSTAMHCLFCHDALHVAMDCLSDPILHPPIVKAHTFFCCVTSQASGLIPIIHLMLSAQSNHALMC